VVGGISKENVTFGAETNTAECWNEKGYSVKRDNEIPN